MRFKFISALIATLAAILSFCVRASAQERVRVALSVRNVVFLPFYYAKDTRIYDKYGLDVELIQMRSDLQLAGLVSGEIDFTPSVGPAGAATATCDRMGCARWSDAGTLLFRRTPRGQTNARIRLSWSPGGSDRK